MDWELLRKASEENLKRLSYLEEENKKLNEDKNKLLKQGLLLKEKNQKLEKSLDHLKWVRDIKFEFIESVLSNSKYNLDQKKIDEILSKIIELHDF